MWTEPWVCANWYSYIDDNNEEREGWCLSYKGDGDKRATVVKLYEVSDGTVDDDILVQIHKRVSKGYEFHIVL